MDRIETPPGTGHGPVDGHKRDHATPPASFGTYAAAAATPVVSNKRVASSEFATPANKARCTDDGTANSDGVPMAMAMAAGKTGLDAGYGNCKSLGFIRMTMVDLSRQTQRGSKKRTKEHCHNQSVI